MKTAASQFDLFDEAPGYRQSPRPVPKKRKKNFAPSPDAWDAEVAAQRLKQSGYYRVLRKVVPRQVVPRDRSAFPNMAVLVETEQPVSGTPGMR